MSKRLVASAGVSPVVHKEIIDGHILLCSKNLFQKLFEKLVKAMCKRRIIYRCGNLLSVTLKSLTLLR